MIVMRGNSENGIFSVNYNCFRKVWACWNTVNIQLFPENLFQFYHEPQIMTTSAHICIHWKLKERCLHCFLHCTKMFVIAEFNPFCRDCTIRHSGDETWNVLNMQHNPKFQKMELFRHPRWWPSHMCDSGHHLRKVPIPDERYMIKKKGFRIISLDVRKVPDWQILWTGPWFNIKTSSYQYRKSHCGDKTILRQSYLHNGISYTG